MGFRTFLVIMGIGTSLAWLSWIYILQSIDPAEAGPLGLIFFYLTALLSVFGTVFLLELAYRILIQKSEYLARSVKASIRHAILLSVAVILSLGFAAADLLRWWVLLLVVLVLAVIEYLFIFLGERKK